MHTKDTTYAPYYRQNKSLAYASAPKSRFHDGGDIVIGNIMYFFFVNVIK